MINIKIASFTRVPRFPVALASSVAFLRRVELQAFSFEEANLKMLEFGLGQTNLSTCFVNENFGACTTRSATKGCSYKSGPPSFKSAVNMARKSLETTGNRRSCLSTSKSLNPNIFPVQLLDPHRHLCSILLPF